MKINRSIIWLMVIVAVVIALVLWHRKKPSVEAPPILVETNGVASPASASGQPAGSVVTDAPVSVTVSNTSVSAMPDKGAQIKEGLAKLNDVGIVFYGRLEDQHGNAVANAP